MKKVLLALLAVFVVGIFFLLVFSRNTTITTARLIDSPVPEEYDAFPYLDNAAWPVMRGDLQNTGRSRFLDWDDNIVTAPEPVHFKTGNGIFSTPVIDDNDRIFVGSADHYFYAYDPLAGEELWRYRTGEIIDSAAALGKEGTIYIPSGDSIIHAVDSLGKPVWKFDVLNDRPRKTFSTSTCFWWEGNVVIGPDGFIYSGNDDFFFYAIDTDGEMRWTYRTGFFIWSAAAFDRENTVYIPSFDMTLYAFDRRDGRLIWKRDLGNPLISSPAVGEDGTIYQGAMDGNVYALDPENGENIWVTKTKGHVYSSAAIAPDGLIYITSADGNLYALNASDGSVEWTFYTGEAVRSSPVIGPDPERKEKYLVYFGGGNGHLYSIDPKGKRRWSYNTLVRTTDYVDYPNINASPAPGRSGIAVASANGDVIWVPYDYYLKDDAKGIVLEPGDGFEKDGASWHYVTPGGQIERKPLPVSDSAEISEVGSDDHEQTKPIEIHPAQTVNLRLLVRDANKTLHASIIGDSVDTTFSPELKHRIEIMGDGVSLAVIPEEIYSPDMVYSLKVTASYRDDAGNKGDLTGTVLLSTPSPEDEIFVPRDVHKESKNPSYVITHMAIPFPPIVPSLDQIGLASLSIPFSIVESDPETGRFSAWSVQRFGETEDGELVGVPDSRILFYAFAGQYKDGAFIMESKNGHFEVTGFPMPLDTLRFAGQIDGEGRIAPGASLYADLTPPGGISGGLKLFNNIFSVSGEEKGGQRNWIMDMYREGGLIPLLTAARASTGSSYRMLKNRIWSEWGFINEAGKFAGTGTYQMKALPGKAPDFLEEIEVLSFEYKGSGRNKTVIAELKMPQAVSGLEMIPGILLIDEETGHPLPINYNLSTVREHIGDNTKKVILTIPKDAEFNKAKAVLMADLIPVSSISLY